MELSQAIENRRSIRRFRQDPVDEDRLCALVHAAALAPSGGNLQAWRFVLVTDPQLVRKVDMFSPGLSGKPPVIIVICSDLKEIEQRGGEKSKESVCLIDASMAAQNMMLKAVELGLGTCAIKSYNDGAVRRLLKLPDTIRIEMLISVGYPDGTARMPKRKQPHEVIRYNRWEDHDGHRRSP